MLLIRIDRGEEKMASDYSDMMAAIFAAQAGDSPAAYSVAEWKEKLEAAIKKEDFIHFWLTNQLPAEQIGPRLKKKDKEVLLGSPKDRKNFAKAGDEIVKELSSI